METIAKLVLKLQARFRALFKLGIAYMRLAHLRVEEEGGEKGH